MAVALGVSEIDPREMTDRRCRRLIAARYGAPMKSTSGIPGAFYTADRERDIRAAAADIIRRRARP